MEATILVDLFCHAYPFFPSYCAIRVRETQDMLRSVMVSPSSSSGKTERIPVTF